MPRLPGWPLFLLDHARAAVRVPARMALAGLLTAAALFLVWLLQPVLGRPYFFVAFAAIVATSVVAGTRYGALTTALFAVGYLYLYLEPRGAFAAARPGEAAGLAGYTLTGLFVAWVGGSLRHAFGLVRAQATALERVQEQREDLVRALAHDLRSPLSVIAASAQIIRLTPGTGEDVLRRAAGIERGVVAATAMVEELVQVAQLESGHVALAREPVDLARLTADLRERLPGAARIRLEVPPGVPPLDADRHHLERVLVNLISNALKYAPGETPVTVRVARGHAEVVVSVSDEGPGVAPEDLSRIFDKYYRTAEARSKEGTGLGLYISRLLVVAHGGRIWATSRAGEGTTVHVALPEVRPQRPA